MICLLDPHDLSSSLARHLAKTDANERTIVRTHGLLGSTINSAFKELRLLATGAQTAKPGAHAILSPSFAYAEEQWQAAWAAFENEMGLTDQPYLEVRHIKVGRGGRTAEHAHRVYLRINDRGKVIRFPHIAPRLEKAARICEHINAEALTPGRWNRAVAKQLEATGRPELAAKMQRAGLLDRERPEATSRAERMATERLKDMSADEVKRAVYLAWQSTTDGPSFELRLREAGFRLCMGDAGRAMVLTSRGASYRLASAVASGAKAVSAKGSVKAADVHARVAGLNLPRVDDARRLIVPTPPVEGWQAITGVERSTLNLADPDREQNRASRRSDNSRNGQELSANPESIPYEVSRKDRAPKPTSNGVVQPLTLAERMEAEAFFQSLRALNSAWLAGPTRGKLNPAGPQMRLPEEAVEHRDEAPSTSLAARGRADTFKADLAEVERRHGAQIRWVDRQVGTTSIHLKDGTKVVASPDRISSPRPSVSTLQIMISAAKLRGYERIRVKAANRTAQTYVARKLLMNGLTLADPTLEAEARAQVQAQFERAVRNWDAKSNAYWIDRSDANMAAVEAEIERMQLRRQEFTAFMPDDADRLFARVDRMDAISKNRRADIADEALAVAESGKPEMRQMPDAQRAKSAAANAMTRGR